MIKFQEILNSECDKLIDNSKYTEFWDNCINHTVKLITTNRFDINSIDEFIDFVLVGIENQDIYFTFKNEYIIKLMHTIRDSIKKYNNLFHILALYDIEINLQTDNNKKLFLINEYKEILKQEKNIHLYTKIYIILINYNMCKPSKNSINYQLKYLYLIFKNKKMMSHDELNLIISKSLYLLQELYKHKRFDKIDEVNKIINRLNIYTNKQHSGFIDNLALLKQFNVEEDII